jgi:hypothetical protein
MGIFLYLSVIFLSIRSNPRILKGFLLNFGVFVFSKIVAPSHFCVKMGGKVIVSF